jgi:acetyltransferase-like isoleucine patch superfamily enzyme
MAKSGKRLVIGSFCSIAPGVRIFLGGEHRTDWASTYPFNMFWTGVKDMDKVRSSKGHVIIGNDVWLGETCLILSGVRIGDGAVIGANTLVTSDVPPYAIMSGNPARLLRFRFNPETIESLLTIAWWNWTDEKIKEFLPLMESPDIGAFIEAARHP